MSPARGKHSNPLAEGDLWHSDYNKWDRVGTKWWPAQCSVHLPVFLLCIISRANVRAGSIITMTPWREATNIEMFSVSNFCHRNRVLQIGQPTRTYNSFLTNWSLKIQDQGPPPVRTFLPCCLWLGGITWPEISHDTERTREAELATFPRTTLILLWRLWLWVSDLSKVTSGNAAAVTSQFQPWVSEVTFKHRRC